MKRTLPCLLVSSWKYVTVEWNPKHVAPLLQQQGELMAQTCVSHYVLPDLPTLYTPQDRQLYFDTVPPNRRIQTIATCRHSAETLLQTVETSMLSQQKTHQQQHNALADDKEEGHNTSPIFLLVGGNDKTVDSSLSTSEAARVIHGHFGGDEAAVTLWGVTNPNDPNSIHLVSHKIDAGMNGFVTQPLLASHALDTLMGYPTTTTTSRTHIGGHDEHDVVYIAGMAMPRTARSLLFWIHDLLEQPELQKDPLVQAHLAFFSQPHYTSLAWIARELEQLSSLSSSAAAATTTATTGILQGVHFMPLGNASDLAQLFARQCVDPSTDGRKRSKQEKRQG